MPHLHQAYDELLNRLENWKPGLVRNFLKSVFSCTTFNFGPQVVCKGHRDHLNWSPGGCAITAGGDYDYRYGGHIVIVELKLIIEFPPGCTVIIPSACFTHGNLPIRPHETRISMTQYTAGGLFRWVDNGFQTAKNLMRTDPRGKAKADEDRWKRWEEAIGLYSTIDELKRWWSRDL